MFKRKLLKKTFILKALLSSSLVLLPNSALAANEFTVLGVGDYSTSSGLNDLDNGDAYKFNTRMSGINWTRTAQYYDSGVWYTDFTVLGNQSDILYFTGHGGANGNLALANRYGSDPNIDFANYYQVGGDILGYNDTPYEDAEWMIFAACNAMQEKRWGKQLANGLHHIFAYGGVSNDYTDTNIINQFIDRVFGLNGWRAETMFSAWDNANSYYGEPDWAIIGHNGNKGDYIHGAFTGATEDILGTSDVYRWNGTGLSYTSENISSYLKNEDSLTKATPTEELNYLNNKYKYKFSINQEKLNSKTIIENIIGTNVNKTINHENNSVLFNNDIGTIELLKDGSLVYSRQKEYNPIIKTQEEVKKDVLDFIAQNGGIRPDLELKSINNIMQENDYSSTVIGYTFNFVQKYEDTYIDGDSGNAITVGVDSNGINFYKRNVKEITIKTKVNVGSVKKMEDVLGLANQKVRTTFKGGEDAKIKSAELVLFSAPIGLSNKYSDLIPAYKFSINENNAIYINLLTGEELNPGKMLTKDEYVEIPSPEFFHK